MTVAPTGPGILLVDDGELDGVARVLDEQGVAYERLRGGRIPEEVAPPRELLIVTPRRVERVRRGSPADAKPGRPLRIVAVDEDSPAMRRRLRRTGLHLLIRQPAEPEIWRLLVARALYKGSERRVNSRVAVGAPIWLDSQTPTDTGDALLIDLSNRGCRLQTSEAFKVGDPIEFMIQADETNGSLNALTLRGRVRRLARANDSAPSMIAVVFDAEMPERDRMQLTALINHWASGPRAFELPAVLGAPAIPPCTLPSLPDLTLDDETDPPIRARSAMNVQLNANAPLGAAPYTGAKATSGASERRTQPRGRYASSLHAKQADRPFVLIGSDLSPGGMRIERHPDLRVGDAFRIALRGPGVTAPFLVDAEVVRDDGKAGFGVRFGKVDRETAVQLEKMVACLPDVESLEDGEIAGLGAILSEILPD